MGSVILQDDMRRLFPRADEIIISEVGKEYNVQIIGGVNATPIQSEIARQLRMEWCAYGQTIKLSRLYHFDPADSKSRLIKLWEVTLSERDLLWNRSECFGYQDGNNWVIDWNHCDNQIILNRYGLYSVADRYIDGFGYGGLICAI